jgi:hypothetical protein
MRVTGHNHIWPSQTAAENIIGEQKEIQMQIFSSFLSRISSREKYPRFSNLRNQSGIRNLSGINQAAQVSKDYKSHNG